MQSQLAERSEQTEAASAGSPMEPDGKPTPDKASHGDAGEKRSQGGDHMSGMHAKASQRPPNDAKPNTSPYEGRFARPGKRDADQGDANARYDSGSYAGAGGTIGGDSPPYPGDGCWEDQGGEGYAEGYGSGRDAGGNGTERPIPGRRRS